MGREDHPLELAERRVGRQWLDGEHVDGGTADALLAERVGQSGFVDELAAGRIHEYRRGLHELEPLGVDEVMGLLGVRDMERNHVGLAEQLIEGKQLELQLGGAFGREIRIVPDHLHAERPRQLGHVPADAPEPHDPDRLAAQLGALEPLAIPLAAAHRLGSPGDVAGQAEQQPHGVLGGADGIGARRVHDRDAAARGRVHVDVVDARPGAGDHAQVGAAREQVGRHARFAPHDERVRARQRALQLFAGLSGAVRDLDFRRRAEQFETSFRHAVGDGHAVGHATSPSSKASSSSSAATV